MKHKFYIDVPYYYEIIEHKSADKISWLVRSYVLDSIGRECFDYWHPTAWPSLATAEHALELLMAEDKEHKHDYTKVVKSYP